MNVSVANFVIMEISFKIRAKMGLCVVLESGGFPPGARVKQSSPLSGIVLKPVTD